MEDHEQQYDPETSLADCEKQAKKNPKVTAAALKLITIR